MRRINCIILLLAFHLIICFDIVLSQTCDEISEKVERISAKITTEDTKLSNFQANTNAELTELKDGNNEFHSSLNSLHLEFNKQLDHLTQRIDTSSRTNINLKNASNLLEIANIQSIQIVELNSKITHLNDIISYFDAKFKILERRAKLKENDESYQEQLVTLKTQMEIMKILLFIVFALFVALKLMILCKWCCCMGTRTSKTSKTEEIEMKSSKPPTKSNVYENSRKSEETVSYENMNYDKTRTAGIGGRKYSNQFQSSTIGTLPKTTTNLKSINHGYYYNESSDELYNNAEHDESQIYETCHVDDSKGKSQQNSAFPPPPKDLLYNKSLNDEEIYYDEFNDGLTDETEAIYDDVNRESTGGPSKIPILVRLGGSSKNAFYENLN